MERLAEYARRDGMRLRPICGFAQWWFSVQIAKGDGPGDPDRLAEAYYTLHQQRSWNELVIGLDQPDH